MNNDVAARILREVRYLANKTYKQFLREITYGNFLMMDDLIVNMLRGKALVEHQERSAYEHISDYRFFDSLIVGSCRYHSTNKSNIFNPFAWKDITRDVMEVFIVPYLFYFLVARQELRKSSIVNFFASAGFRSQLVEDALEKLRGYHLLHFEGNEIINPHRKVIEAYKGLILQPAVMDNYAITTPVRKQTITSRWIKTNGYDPTMFYSRCLTTKLFLKELNELETIVETKIQDVGSLDSFRDDIPRISGQMLNYYNKRLAQARDSGWPANAEMSLQKWKDLQVEAE